MNGEWIDSDTKKYGDVWFEKAFEDISKILVKEEGKEYNPSPPSLRLNP